MDNSSGTDGLFVFEIGPDYYIAHDEEDAWSLWEDHSGETREDYKNEPCVRLSDDAKISILVDEDGVIVDNHDADVLTLTAREWIEREGHGFLCSSEF